jgi:hypothetical protein
MVDVDGGSVGNLLVGVGNRQYHQNKTKYHPPPPQYLFKQTI